MNNILNLFLFLFIIVLVYFTNNIKSCKNFFANRFEDNIDCYVITLGSKNRLNNIAEQQRKLPFKVNLFNAFDGNVFNNSNYRNELKEDGLLDEKEYWSNSERIRNKEIGCYLSHTNLYKMVQGIKQNNQRKYTIIFEDDFKINDDFVDNLQKGLNILDNKNFDILYLGIMMWEKPGIEIEDRLDKYKDGAVIGTHAYLINNESIDKFVENTKFINRPIDWKLTDLIQNKKLEMYYFYPSICVQSKEIESEIRNKN